MAKDKKADVYIAIDSGAYQAPDGEVMIFVKDKTRVRAGHPLLLSNPQYFAPADEDVHYEVERATAAPGEKRGEE